MPSAQKSTLRVVTTTAILIVLCVLLSLVVAQWRSRVHAAGVSAQPTGSAAPLISPLPTGSATPSDTPWSATSTGDPEPTAPIPSGSVLPSTQPAPAEGSAPPATDSVPPLATAGEPAPPSPDPRSAKAGKQGVHPIVTFAGWNSRTGRVEVSGFVNSVIEQDGVCTAELTRADQKVTVSREASASATTTDCGNIVIAKSRLGSGSWQAVLTYESGASFGASEPTTVKVP